jgi:hypothetical protein
VGLATRDVGSFLLRGKSVPVRVHELLGDGVDRARQTALAAPFAVALGLFEGARWSDARGAFAALSAAFPEDGPTAYYSALSAEYAQHPPRSWSGAIVVAAK